MTTKNHKESLLGYIISLENRLDKRLGIFGHFSLKLFFGMALSLGSLFLFATLAEDLMFNELAIFDRIGTNIVRSISSNEVTTIMKMISDLGSPFALAFLGTCAMVYTGLNRRHFWDTFLIPLVLGGGMILNWVLKLLFHRQRPTLPHLVEATGFSFPSGHAMLSFIFYGLVAYLVLLNFPGKALKTALICLLTLLILAIGASRIYLGVHYPSDVLAGFAAGSFWLTACIFGFRRIRHYKDQP